MNGAPFCGEMKISENCQCEGCVIALLKSRALDGDIGVTWPLLLLLLLAPPPPHLAVVAEQQRRYEEEQNLFFGGSSGAAGRMGSRRGGASLRSADAAQVCNNVGSFPVDGVVECSAATAARQIVSERW